MKHRIYVAAPSEHWDRARILADAVRIELGDAEVVSRWHERPIEKYPDREDVRAVQIAMNCSGLDKATIVIVLCDAGTPRTTFADAAYAIGRGTPVVWVRGRHKVQQCLFDAHPRVRVIDANHAADLVDLAERIGRVISNELGEVA